MARINYTTNNDRPEHHVGGIRVSDYFFSKKVNDAWQILHQCDVTDIATGKTFAHGTGATADVARTNTVDHLVGIGWERSDAEMLLSD